MKEPLWQRRRNRQAKDGAGDDGAESVAESPSPPASPRNPAEIRARLRDSSNTRLTDVAGSDDPVVATDDEADPARQAAYAAWADRMKSHKKDKLADIPPDVDPDQEVSRAAPSVYWDASNLFQPAPEEVRADPSMMETRQLLGILEVTDGSDERELQLAYRRLAKEHHPDRWQAASPEEQAEHQERMALISEAYSEIRRRMS